MNIVNRRFILSLGLIIIIGVAGIQFFFLGNGQEELKQYPAKPETLNEASVVKYIEKYESTYKYNREVRRYKEDDQLDYLLGIKTCLDEDYGWQKNAWFKKETEEGFYVTAFCPIDIETKGSMSGSRIHDWAAYFVSQNATVRVNLERKAPLNRIVNFDTQRRSVNVTVTYLNASKPQQVLSKEYDLKPKSEVGLGEHVAKKKGLYRIEVRSGAEEVVHTHEIHKGANVFKNTRVYVSPYGDLVLVHTEEEEPN